MTVKLTQEEIKNAHDNAFNEPVYLDHKPTMKDIFFLQLNAIALEAQRKLFRELRANSSLKRNGWRIKLSIWDSIKEELGIK